MKEKIICEYCNKEFNSRTSMTNHRRWHNVDKYKKYQENFRKSKTNTWREEEINFIKDNYINMSNKQLSENINRTLNSIGAKIFKLRLNGERKWNKERMKQKNPMFNKEVSDRSHNSAKERWKNQIHPNKNRKRPDLKERQLLNNTNKNGNSVRGKHTWSKYIHPMLGKHHNEMTKEKIRTAHLGKKHRIETIELMKIKHGKGKDNINYGKHVSKEAIDKFKEYRKTQILPKKDTSIEIKIRSFLDKLQIEYFQHKYMTISHGYQCDFFIPSKNMVIECDGDYWHKYPTGRDIDKIRTSELIEKGFKVLRLWEHEIKVMDLNKFQEKLI